MIIFFLKSLTKKSRCVLRVGKYGNHCHLWKQIWKGVGNT